MAKLASELQAQIAFKNLLGKSQTDPTLAIGGEAQGIKLITDAQTVFVDTIPEIPALPTSVGYTASLVLNPLSNGHAFYAVYNTLPSGNDPKTGVAFAWGAGTLTGKESYSTGDVSDIKYRVENSIPDSYGYQYEAGPKDSIDTPIPVNDSMLWLYQYQNGIFYRHDETTGTTPAKIDVQIYTGNTLKNTIAASSTKSEYVMTGNGTQTTWEIHHNSNSYVLVNVYDAKIGKKVAVEVDHINLNRCDITFNTAPLSTHEFNAVVI